MGVYRYPEESGYKCLHPGVHRQRRTVGRIKHSKLQHRPQEIPLLAKGFDPAAELYRPFISVAVGRIASRKIKHELVVRIILESIDRHQGNIKIIEVSKVIHLVFTDKPDRPVFYAKRTVLLKVHQPDIVYQVLE